MNQNLPDFRALDFTEEDILFAPLVRFHFEMEAMEDLRKLEAGEFSTPPEEAAAAQKRVQKYYRREERLRALRRGYGSFQKVAVFLVVLCMGFTFLTVRVEAVNRAVVGWLTEVYQTHTDLSVQIGNGSTVDLSAVSVNWIPEGLTIQRESTSLSATYEIYCEDQIAASIKCRISDSNMDLNTEDAKVTYLYLSTFDKTFLIERDTSIILVATNPNIVITIIAFKQSGYNFSTGEVLHILQNIAY
jgi:hypothetical protein